MMNEEEYKKEIVRMWDSVRTRNKGCSDCRGVPCSQCPLRESCGTRGITAWNAFKMIEAVEKWSREHQPKKYKVSRMEYDILQTVINSGSTIDTFNDFRTLSGLLEKGYFEGATGSMYISDYYNNCEIEDNKEEK